MTPPQRDVLVAIGVALLMIQTTERVIKLCMTFVLQRSNPLTLETLERQKKEERKKTLGYFLSELRKRTDLDDKFDALLEQFLEKRNVLVHDFGERDEFSLNTPAGLAGANEFIRDLIQITEEVLKVFVGLVLAWQEQTGIGPENVKGQSFFEEIEAAYKPLVNEVFFRKSDQH